MKFKTHGKFEKLDMEKKMKKTLLVAIIILTQVSFAAVVGKRLTSSEAAQRVERSATYKEIVKARESDKDIAADPKLMEKVSKMLDLSLKDIMNSTGNTEFIKLINISAKEVLTVIAELASTVKDSTTTAQEKNTAKKALELIVLASTKNVDSLTVNAQQAQKQKDTVQRILEISKKISSLDFGDASKTFIEKYETALVEGKTVEEAIRIASNNKFGEKELRECE